MEAYEWVVLDIEVLVVDGAWMLFIPKRILLKGAFKSSQRGHEEDVITERIASRAFAVVSGCFSTKSSGSWVEMWVGVGGGGGYGWRRMGGGVWGGGIWLGVCRGVAGGVGGGVDGGMLVGGCRGVGGGVG